MREHRCCPNGEIVDLDNPETYQGLPTDINELRRLMFEKIGYSHCYMNFWHGETFHDELVGRAQIKRVEKLVKGFTENEKANYDNLAWYQEQVFLFEDEIENMC